MKRVMMVDDERPVLDGISLMIRRDLSAEFEIAGTASSGREAIERAATLAPDIVLMDVSMPGISGLDAIREIRKRGLSPVFILVTAYERFDIAREAVELGVVDYLLKPVNRDKLAQALRAASGHIDQRGAVSQREFEVRELEDKLRAYAATAFLHGIMLGEDIGPELGRWQTVLGAATEWGLVLCLAFLPPPGMGAEAGGVAEVFERYRTAMRFKSRALVGPLVSGRSLALIWLRDPAAATREIGAFHEILDQVLPRELELGLVRLGCGSVQPLARLSHSWHDALGDLGRSGAGADEGPAGAHFDFEADNAFLEELLGGSPARALVELDRILAEPGGQSSLTEVFRFRLIGLLTSACRQLVQRGLLARELLPRFMELRMLVDAPDGDTLGLMARAWVNEVAGSIGTTPLWSAPVAKTIAWIRENFGAALSLETAADLTGISASRLSKLFIAETGLGFSEYLIGLRIQRAKELLSQPGASIKQVSLTCGYPDPNYFARLFKKETGFTPTAYAAAKEADNVP